MDSPYIKIAVFTPVSHSDALREAIALAGAGSIGNYDFCSFTTRGVGRFRPLKDSKPFIGKEGTIEEVEEDRIEFICPKGLLEKVLGAIQSVHPYEEPAIDVYPLLSPT